MTSILTSSTPIVYPALDKADQTAATNADLVRGVLSSYMNSGPALLPLKRRYLNRAETGHSLSSVDRSTIFAPCRKGSILEAFMVSCTTVGADQLSVAMLSKDKWVLGLNSSFSLSVISPVRRKQKKQVVAAAHKSAIHIQSRRLTTLLSLGIKQLALLAASYGVFALAFPW